MAKLPDNVLDSQTVAAIYAAYEKAHQPRHSRRLGASVIGKECDRAIWYDFRWAGRETMGGRMLRLLETGNLEESRFVANLRAIGCEVHDRDPATGQQWEYTYHEGHVVAKLDAAALGVPEAPKTWHAVSMKTASEKSFKEIRAKGVKAAKPEHYAQVVVELKLSGLTRALYIVRNKNTDELYAERFRWEDVWRDATYYLDRAKRIIDSRTAPERVSEDRTKLPCKFCTHADRCFGAAAPAPAVPVNINCRTCVYSTPEHDTDYGRWSCHKRGTTLSTQQQETACEHHMFLPSFIVFAATTDAGESPDGDWVEYTNPDGRKWYQSNIPPGFKSKELTILPAPLVTEAVVEQIKGMGGTVVEGVGDE
jgi:hypothetical protein